MEIRIDMKGFDKVEKMLDEMTNDITPTGFGIWAEKIEKTAKEICKDDKGDRITFKAKKGTTTISMRLADKRAIESLKKAIKHHQNSMSLGIRAFYEQGLPPELAKIEKQFEN